MADRGGGLAAGPGGVAVAGKERAGAFGRCRGIGAGDVVAVAEGTGVDEDPSGADGVVELFVWRG